jgi:hypothetical protein
MKFEIRSFFEIEAQAACRVEDPSILEYDTVFIGK